jgi:phosphate transport system protein
MSLHLQRDLENLNREILVQAGRVEQMFQRSMQSIFDHRYELAEGVCFDDDIIDRHEVRLEEECLKLLALHQPVAGDLRRIATILKLNTDLERIADLVCNIAERARSLQSFPYFPMSDELPEMSKLAAEMLRFAMDAFVTSDTKKAFEVMEAEQQVDDLNRSIIAEITDLIRSDTSLVDAALHVFSLSRHIEQIADLAENIAEEVVYMIDGEIIRHKFTSLRKDFHA